MFYKIIKNDNRIISKTLQIMKEDVITQIRFSPSSFNFCNKMVYIWMYKSDLFYQIKIKDYKFIPSN